ncbi:hypothetical protein BN11_1540001 [Nostocoides australiense Ben110]|uniref:Uncharacterized protein n=1 Tax=Nostocoides australiense Ben110 TaxID=1193182 RepID=W6JUS2_9MICO|nr:hypothetical protein BN11_1540001 [Tetrasphaera australiensis Ben110]
MLKLYAVPPTPRGAIPEARETGRGEPGRVRRKPGLVLVRGPPYNPAPERKPGPAHR